MRQLVIFVFVRVLRHLEWKPAHPTHTKTKCDTAAAAAAEEEEEEARDPLQLEEHVHHS